MRGLYAVLLVAGPLLLVTAAPAAGAAAADGAAMQPATTQAAATQPGGAKGKPAGDGGGASELMLWQDFPTVLAATKYAQTQSEAPASVTIVTAEDIELFGYRSLADILRTQRSFFLHNDGLWSFAGVRGFLRPGEWNARILVMVDGRPTRDPIYGTTHLDQGMVVPIAAIKRSEIIRGPGSALYGSNAVFAVINIITRDGQDVKNWLEVEGQAGTKDTALGATTFGHKFANGLEVLVSGERFSSAGDRHIDYAGVHDAARNFGRIDYADFEGAGNVFVKARYGELTFEADYEKRSKDNRAATYLTLWDDPGRATDSRSGFTAKWDHKIDDSQGLHAMAYYGRYNYDQDMPYDGGAGVGRYLYTSTADADWIGSDVHYDWQWSPQDRLVLGSETMCTLEADQYDYDTAGGVDLDQSRSVRWWALYAQNEYSPTTWLTLTGGLRADFWDRFDPLLNPRAAAILRPTKADTIKLLYGRAFRAPNLYETYYTVPGSNAGNRELVPEINDTYEVAWSHDFLEGLKSEISVYYWRVSKSLVDGTDPVSGDTQTQNDGVQQAKGIEAEIEKRWKWGGRLRVSGTLGRAVDAGAPHALARLGGVRFRGHSGAQPAHLPGGRNTDDRVHARRRGLPFPPELRDQRRADLQGGPQRPGPPDRRVQHLRPVCGFPAKQPGRSEPALAPLPRGVGDGRLQVPVLTGGAALGLRADGQQAGGGRPAWPRPGETSCTAGRRSSDIE
jgi:outer membrane receptor for ferrienterochelin and colicins